MIAKLELVDIDLVMQLWLDVNIKTHSFIDKNYWKNAYFEVINILPKADIYVCKNDGNIQGFIGLEDNYIAGIFVSSNAQSLGIGKQLIDFVKRLNDNLVLRVYKKNNRAIKFYLRENFIIKSQQIDTNTNELELLMQWNSYS